MALLSVVRAGRLVAMATLTGLLAATVLHTPTAMASTPGPDPTAAAWAWLVGQQGTGTTVTSASTIGFARQYPTDWTGALTGSFVPQGVSSTVVHSSSIVVDQPAAVPGDFSGTASGHITLTPSANRWIVQVYRDTDSGRVSEPLQTLVAADGSFSIDLGAVQNPPPGTWALGLLDAQNSYIPTGTVWPGDTYADWQVRAYVVTDTAYLVGSQPANTDGRFAFASSNPGTKIVQLVDVNTGAVLAEQAPDFGLLRSFATGDRSYTYDQAIAVIAAVGLGHDASRLTTGLLALQNQDGGFNESADVRNPQAATPIQRSGITAVAAYALLRELRSIPAGDAARSTIESAARAALTWLLNLRNNQGLVTAGQGDYTSGGAPDPGLRPTWVSTEHNLDTWQVLTLAAQVLGDQDYTTDADALARSILAVLWNPAAGRFQQGLDPNGNPDTTDPLDVSSWATLFLLDSGHADLAQQAFAHVSAFASTVGSAAGYRAYYPQAAFPNAPANVWAEGTAGVSIAAQRLGHASQADGVNADLQAVQRADGSLPYAAVADQPTSMTTDSSVAATAWYVLARLGAGAIWDAPTGQ